MNDRCLWRTGILLVAAALAVPATALAGGMQTATPAPMVQTYETLADTILAAKRTEWNLVHSILASTYRHAEAVARQARAEIKAGKSAGGQLEALAELVTQLGNEGDAAVAGVRKRLIEGGHHHHSSAGDKGKYDEGFVIVTRDAKKAFLDAGKKIGQLARKPDLAGLDAEWTRVEKTFAQLHEGARK